jgi:hypothetical protein
MSFYFSSILFQACWVTKHQNIKTSPVFFGDETYSRCVLGEGFAAPYKWWYCMGAVAISLAGIELFKLIAIRFMVWTKR